jgi:cytochrome c-type biogenesis protein CcmF
LIGTALLHSVIVTEKRNMLVLWTLFLGMLAFILSMTGLFLVRSGIVTSVHAFASDPARGIYILSFLALLAGGGFSVFAARAQHLRSSKTMSFPSREGMLVINNVFFLVLCGVVLMGTLYPLLLQVLSNIFVSVGAPYFNTTVNPMVVAVALLAVFAPYVAWKKDLSWQQHIQHILVITLGVIVGTITWFSGQHHPVVVAALSIGTMLLCSTSWLFIARLKSAKHLTALPLRFVGMVLAHSGLGVLLVGLAVVIGWQKEKELLLPLDGHVDIAGYDAQLSDMVILTKENYLARRGKIILRQKGKEEVIKTLEPEVRYYPVEKQNTTEAALYYGMLSNVYVALGDTTDDGKFAVRLYYKPWINLLGLGALMLVLGGMAACFGKKDKKHTKAE